MTPFQAGIYPVTNAQFAPFIEAGGYDEPRWWGNAALKAQADFNSPYQVEDMDNE